MLLQKIQPLLAYITPYDLGEIICCIMITLIILHHLYKKQGPRWYTLSYVVALSIVISWILSYQIISSALIIAVVCYYFISQTDHHPITTANVYAAPHNLQPDNWIETMFSLSIQAFHEGVSLSWIIDLDEQLNELLHTEITLHVYLVPKLNQLILNTIDLTSKSSALWMNCRGYIMGINPCKSSTQVPPSFSDIALWSKQKKIIMLQGYAQKRMFTVVHSGIVRDNLSSHQAYNTIKHILTPPHTSIAQEMR